jgi:hypothetical protein
VIVVKVASAGDFPAPHDLGPHIVLR